MLFNIILHLRTHWFGLNESENNMKTKRYLVSLISYGGVLNTEDSNHPWHPAKWMTYRGDMVKVFDRLCGEYLPDYYIQKDGE